MIVPILVLTSLCTPLRKIFHTRTSQGSEGTHRVMTVMCMRFSNRVSAQFSTSTIGRMNGSSLGFQHGFALQVLN